MSKTRSPNYPSTDLESALEAVKPVFKAENRNKFSRLVLAQHLGYSSLNGRALGKIGAIRAFGLLEGTGDNLRLSSEAITALAAPEGSDEQKAALAKCALAPTLFQEISKAFEGLPSEKNLHFWLVKRGFTAEAASKAVIIYLATMDLVGGIEKGYKPSEKSQANAPSAGQLSLESQRLLAMSPTQVQSPKMLQEVFNLDEGPVTLSFPENLTPVSYQDLEDQLNILLRRLKRRAERVEDQRREEEGPAD